MQDARAPADGQRRSVPAGVDAIAARLDADELDLLVGDERGEDPQRVGAAAHASHHARRQPPLALEHLRTSLVADYPLQIAHERRIRRRADDRADHVVRALHVRHPVADRRRGRLLERARARVDRLHPRAQQLHPLHVRALTAGVLDAHVDDALHVQQRTHGRRRHAVLAGARLGDDPPLAHAPGQQHLAERVVELVRARVVEILALQVHGPPGSLGEPAREVQRRRAPGEVAQQAVQLRVVLRVRPRLEPRLLQLRQRRHQRLGHELSAVEPEAMLQRALVRGCAHAG